MVQQIDFLPDSYHQIRQRREKKVWRRALLVVFLSLIVLGAAGQRRMLARLQQDRDHQQQQASEMTAQLANADELRVQIQRLDAQANLVTHLRFCVPTTRILAAVTNSLPRFVTLTECRSTRETIDSKASSRPNLRKKKQEQDKSSEKHPEQLDLEQLEENARRTGLFVSLAGFARDDVTISGYLAALEATEVFDEVRLLYTDQYVYRDHPLRKFEMRLRVRNPFGSGQNTQDTRHAGTETRTSLLSPVSCFASLSLCACVPLLPSVLSRGS